MNYTKIANLNALHRLWKVSPFLLCNKLSPSKLFNMNSVFLMSWEIIRFPPPLPRPPRRQTPPSSSWTSTNKQKTVIKHGMVNKGINSWCKIRRQHLQVLRSSCQPSSLAWWPSCRRPRHLHRWHCRIPGPLCTVPWPWQLSLPKPVKS